MMTKEGIFCIQFESFFAISISMKWQWTAGMIHSAHYNFLLVAIVSSIFNNKEVFALWLTDGEMNMSQRGLSFFMGKHSHVFLLT